MGASEREEVEGAAGGEVTVLSYVDIVHARERELGQEVREGNEPSLDWRFLSCPFLSPNSSRPCSTPCAAEAVPAYDPPCHPP